MTFILIIFYIIGCLMAYKWVKKGCKKDFHKYTNSDMIFGLVICLFSWIVIFPALIEGTVFNLTDKQKEWFNKESKL